MHKWALKNVDVDGRITTLQIEGDRIAAVGARISTGEYAIDCGGDRVLPGLINAHDHLQWNGLSRTESMERYTNVRQWIAAVGENEASHAARHAASVPRRDRLLLGGVKNLLSGVTTVAHHDPYYPEFAEPWFPIDVMVRYGWSHSLSVDGAEAVKRSYSATSSHDPWIVHAGEGVDDDARAEFCSLEQLGCVRENTFLVHGVAFDDAALERMCAAGATLVWCPSSNLFLFGKTLTPNRLIACDRVLLGSDSRLTGANDLLSELRAARELSGVADDALEAMVTRVAARRLRMSDRGELRVGARADLVVLPRGMQLTAVSRADIRLVAVAGSPRYGDARYSADWNPMRWTEVIVDGRPKLLDRTIASVYSQSSCSESGLEISSGRAWRIA